MDYLSALILGIVQGLTEFLPVSSSGHLEIIKEIFNTNYEAKESLLMTVVLHFATALSTIFIFRIDILKIFVGVFKEKDDSERQFAFKIIFSMIPAALVVFFEDIIESFFNGQLILVAAMLILTGILLLADKAKESSSQISILNSFVIGISQAIAILPGISRSGATIATSVILGVDKTASAKFSF